MNAIITSGSDYIRFNDGTQICWGKKTWEQSGSVGSESILTVTFPQQFTSTPRVVAMLSGYAGALMTLRGNGASTNGCSFYVRTDSAFSTDDTEADWIAIGKWK